MRQKRRLEFAQKLTAAGIHMRPFYEAYYRRFPDAPWVEFAVFCRVVEQPLTAGDYRMAKNADILFGEIKKKENGDENETGRRT